MREIGFFAQGSKTYTSTIDWLALDIEKNRKGTY
jgi:hypothetical protein